MTSPLAASFSGWRLVGAASCRNHVPQGCRGCWHWALHLPVPDPNGHQLSKKPDLPLVLPNRHEAVRWDSFRASRVSLGIFSSIQRKFLSSSV